MYRLDNEVDLHGYTGTVSMANRRELFEHLKAKGVTHINCLRHGRVKRYRVR